MCEVESAHRRARLRGSVVSRLSLCGVGFAAAALCATDSVAQFPAPIEGKPVAAKDISGKKFCWDNGNWIHYGADGRFSNSRDKEGRWSVPQPGVIKTGFGERQVEVLPDGKLHMHWYVLRGKTHDRDLWGTVCN